MERNLTSGIAIAKFAALVAFSILCAAVTLAVVDVNTRIAVTFQKLDNEIDEMHRLTLEAGLTAMEARKASAKEISYLDTWNNQISQSVTDFQEVMLQTRSTLATIQDTSQAATGAIQTTQATVQALQAPIVQADVTLKALQPVIAHTDALVTDPAITATLANVRATTAHLDATAADVQEAVHKYTHPTLLHKLWGGILDVAHVFNPL